MTQNGGLQFKSGNPALNGFNILDIAVNPESSSDVFFLGDSGIYESQDGGVTLHKIDSEVKYDARFSGSHPLLFNNEVLWVGTADNGVWVFIKSGSDWQKHFMGLDDKKINSLALYQDNILAATPEGVYRYDDSVWDPFNTGLDSGSSNIVDLTSIDDDHVYLVEKSRGLYHLNPAEKNWSLRSPATDQFPSLDLSAYKALGINPAQPDVVFLATDPEVWPYCLFRSEDGGLTWTHIENFSMPDGPSNYTTQLEAVEEVSFSPDGSAGLLTDWWNVWKTTDSGLHWTRLHKGLQNTIVNDVLASRSDPQTIYIAASDNGLMKSSDCGKSWAQKMSGVKDGDGIAIAESPTRDNVLYLLMRPWVSDDTKAQKYYYVYKSLDGGESWTEFMLTVDRQAFAENYIDESPQALALDPTDDNIVYIGINGYGIYKLDTSANPPQATEITAHLEKKFLKGTSSFWIDPDNPQTILASSQGGGVYKTTDGGTVWVLITPEDNFTFNLLVNPNNYQEIYVALPKKQVLHSRDGGESWNRIDLPGDHPDWISSFSLTLDDPGRLYVGTIAYDCKASDGIYVSSDGGASFSQIPTDLPLTNVNVLKPYPAGGVLVGYGGIGLYKLTCP